MIAVILYSMNYGYCMILLINSINEKEINIKVNKMNWPGLCCEE